MKKKIGIKKNKDTPFQNLLADKNDPTLPSAKYKIKVTPKISKEIDLNKTNLKGRLLYDEFDDSFYDTLPPQITPAEFEKALKDNGQFTDKEIEENKATIKTKLFKNLSTGELLKSIKNDISTGDMFNWITKSITLGLNKPSVDDIIKKFAYLYINKLDIIELLELQYQIEDKIKSKVKELSCAKNKNKEILG